MRISRKLAGIVSIVVGSAACADTTPARIDVPIDTVVVNSTVWAPLGVRVLDRRGRAIEHARVAYTGTPDSLFALSTNGAVRCLGDGTGVVEVRSAALSRRLPVRCELVDSFSPTGVVELTVGGPPVPLAFNAYDVHGRLMPRARLPVVVGDTSVVALRKGLIYGLKPGTTRVYAVSNARFGGYLVHVVPRAQERHARTVTGDTVGKNP